MIWAFRKIFSLIALLAVFVSANHCAVEDLGALNYRTSNCTPVQSESHPHGSPCRELISDTIESVSKLNRFISSSYGFIIYTSISRFISCVFDLAYFNDLSAVQYFSASFYKRLMSILILSPNAPPIA